MLVDNKNHLSILKTCLLESHVVILSIIHVLLEQWFRRYYLETTSYAELWELQVCFVIHVFRL